MFLPDRLDDWPERLAVTLARHRLCAFAWGSFDCATLFSDAVRAVTGMSPFDGLEPWRSQRSALRVLVGAGATSVQDYLAQRLPAIPVSSLRRGDVGHAGSTEPLCCPAIVTGAEAVSRDERGWIVVPISALTVAYKVGR